MGQKLTVLNSFWIIDYNVNACYYFIVEVYLHNRNFNFFMDDRFNTSYIQLILVHFEKFFYLPKCGFN